MPRISRLHIFPLLFLLSILSCWLQLSGNPEAAASPESTSRPKVMILVDENYVGMEDKGMAVVAAEMASRLAARGYRIVDMEQRQKLQAEAEIRQVLAGDINAAQSVGLGAGAQFIVVGKAVAENVGEAYPGSGIRSLQANLQVKIIQTQTATLVGSVVKKGLAAHISPTTGATEALQQAAGKAVDEFIDETITAEAARFAAQGTPTTLLVSGVDSFGKYRFVSEAIGAMEAIESAEKENWNKSGGLLTMTIRFQGSTEDLAKLLDDHDWGEHRLEITDLAPHRLDCTLH